MERLHAAFDVVTLIPWVDLVTSSVSIIEVANIAVIISAGKTHPHTDLSVGVAVRTAAGIARRVGVRLPR